jgi:hypothetical protein
MQINVNKDTVTTVVGVLGAVAGAVQPVVNANATGNFDAKGIAQLVLSIAFAVVSWFVGKPSGNPDAQPSM